MSWRLQPVEQNIKFALLAAVLRMVMVMLDDVEHGGAKIKSKVGLMHFPI